VAGRQSELRITKSWLVTLSVVMAVRNGEPHVREAIESVLAQSFTDFEFIIVDDASTDDTRAILSDYRDRDSRIEILHNADNLGPYVSANRALMHARGNVVARHDADDISPPDRFAIQLEALKSDDEVSLVTGDVEVFADDDRQGGGTFRHPSWQPRLEWELLFSNAVGAGGHVMFPRVFRGAPILFPAKYFYAEDYGLWCTLSRLGRVVCPQQTIYCYRQHGSSITSLKRTEQTACAAQIRREYQSRYLRSDSSSEAAEQLSRFWTMADGRRPLEQNARRTCFLLDEIRSNFLGYIGHRYGLSASARLEAELNETLRDRLGYWLFRSLRFLDGMGCCDVLAVANARREAMTISGKALREAASALVRKLARTRSTIAGESGDSRTPARESEASAW
jgi:glycosyltransferase involved in cell wall biosynthesis